MGGYFPSLTRYILQRIILKYCNFSLNSWKYDGFRFWCFTIPRLFLAPVLDAGRNQQKARCWDFFQYYLKLFSRHPVWGPPYVSHMWRMCTLCEPCQGEYTYNISSSCNDITWTLTLYIVYMPLQYHPHLLPTPASSCFLPTASVPLSHFPSSSSKKSTVWSSFHTFLWRSFKLVRYNTVQVVARRKDFLQV
jgi:hypothetical protein